MLSSAVHPEAKRTLPCRRPWLPALLALLLSAPVPADASVPVPEVTVALDRQSVTLGDPIELTLTVKYDSAFRMITPQVGRTLGTLEVLGDTVLADGLIEGGLKTYARRIRLAAFETGDLWTAPLRGELIDSAGVSTPWQSDSLALTVASVLGDADPDSVDIRGLKAQYEVPLARWWWWLVGGVLIAALLLLYWRLRRRRRVVDSAAPEHVEPAWESALKALQSMRDEIDPSTDGGRLWYFSLSGILRRYFDRRYGWASVDETTTEVMRRLDNAPFNHGHQDRAREFFRVADEVRYARTPARPGRPEADWDWVREFVRATVPVTGADVLGSAPGAPGNDTDAVAAARTGPEPPPEETRP